MRDQPGLAFPVPYLLTPERPDRPPVVVPDERRGRESDSLTLRLQPPADIDVVAGALVDGVETTDRQQRIAPERHVAARDVLRDPILEQHVDGPARRARHTLGQRRIVLGTTFGPPAPTTSV